MSDAGYEARELFDRMVQTWEELKQVLRLSLPEHSWQRYQAYGLGHLETSLLRSGGDFISYDGASSIEAAVEELEAMEDDDPEEEEESEEACPGCGCLPGDGLTEGCEDELGCGYWRREHAKEGRS